MDELEMVWECGCGHTNAKVVLPGGRIKHHFDDRCERCNSRRGDCDLYFRKKCTPTFTDSQEETIRAIVFEILTENSWKFAQE